MNVEKQIVEELGEGRQAGGKSKENKIKNSGGCCRSVRLRSSEWEAWDVATEIFQGLRQCSDTSSGLFD